MLNKYVNKTLILVPIFTNLSIPGPSLWLYILHMILESSLIYERSLTSSEVRFLVKQNNHRGETSFDCFGRVREIGPPFSAEASYQVTAIPGQNEAFTFDLTNVER